MKKITKKNKELQYVYILDESGSMSGLWDSTIESVNAQIASVKRDSEKLGIDAYLTLVTFDCSSRPGRPNVRFLYENKPFSQVKPITKNDYSPDGGTPLRDAIGESVERLQKNLGGRITDKNIHILVNIFTDGEENSSVKFSHGQIQKMIKHLQKGDKWTFAFMGAGGIKEVREVAASFNISANNTMAFANNLKGHTICYAALSSGTSNYMTDYARGVKSKGVFSEQES